MDQPPHRHEGEDGGHHQQGDPVAGGGEDLGPLESEGPGPAAGRAARGRHRRRRERRRRPACDRRRPAGPASWTATATTTSATMNPTIRARARPTTAASPAAETVVAMPVDPAEVTRRRWSGARRWTLQRWRASTIGLRAPPGGGAPTRRQPAGPARTRPGPTDIGRGRDHHRLAARVSRAVREASTGTGGHRRGLRRSLGRNNIEFGVGSTTDRLRRGSFDVAHAIRSCNTW